MGLRVPGHPLVTAPVPIGLPPRRFPKSPCSHNTDALLSAATQDLHRVLGAVFQRETHGQLCAPSYKSQCRARLRSRSWSRGGDVPAREAPGGSEGGCPAPPRPLRVWRLLPSPPSPSPPREDCPERTGDGAGRPGSGGSPRQSAAATSLEQAPRPGDVLPASCYSVRFCCLAFHAANLTFNRRRHVPSESPLRSLVFYSDLV